MDASLNAAREAYKKGKYELGFVLYIKLINFHILQTTIIFNAFFI